MKAPERFLYHSFPRRHGNDVIKRGLSIVESVIDRGLLLTPERVDFREEATIDRRPNDWTVFQKRICFTELTPSELNDHAKVFGPFAFEWDIEAVVQMGGIPVFYFPLRHTPGTLDGNGSTMWGCIGEVQNLLDRVERLRLYAASRPNVDEHIPIAPMGQPLVISRCTAGGAIDVLNYLQSELRPINHLGGAMRGLTNLMYPTDSPKYTEALGYYRQREWRISGNMAMGHARVTGIPTLDDIAALLKNDDGFLARELEFPNGRDAVVRQCQLYRTFKNELVVSSIRRLVVPSAAIDEVRSLLALKNLSHITVVKLENLKDTWYRRVLTKVSKSFRR